MIQELSNKVWANPRFHDASGRIELAWLTREVLQDGIPLIKEGEIIHLVEAASILACSNNFAHRRSAFRVATCIYDLFGTSTLPLDQALHVILARLGNFPSIGTRGDVERSLQMLPWSLATETISSADQQTVTLKNESLQLTNFQYDLWLALMQRHKIAVAAPTSTGKSFVLQKYLASLFTQREGLRSVVYLVPTRALIAQFANDFKKQLRLIESQAEVVTVPLDDKTDLPDQAVYVMTQERLQPLLDAHPEFSPDVIVIDEAQSISDGSRGVLLQWVIEDLLARSPKAQILFASPTVRNLEVFGKLFALSDIEEFTSFEPTVAQNFLAVKIESATKGRISVYMIDPEAQATRLISTLQLDQTIANKLEKLVHIAAQLGKGKSNIIYANGAAEAENIALLLSDLLSDREPTEEQTNLANLVTEAVHSDYVLTTCVKKGVAFHYANIPTHVRKGIEAAFMSGALDFLVCTSTLLQGVNLPAKNIFMCYPEKGSKKPLESTDFWNLAGRAGRLRREFQGNIFLIDYDGWEKKPLEGPKDSVVIPAIESDIKRPDSDLIELIGDDQDRKGKGSSDLETTFVHLYTQLKLGDLDSILSRTGVDQESPQGRILKNALLEAEKKITLPIEVIKKTPTVSVHKQQRLYNYLKKIIDAGPSAAQELIPKHPREPEAFVSFAEIFKLCHELILGIDTSKNLHRFHAVIALKWMKGISLPEIIDDQIKRRPSVNTRTTIRSTLKLVEEDMRFQAVRFFGCYDSLLAFAVQEAGLEELASSIPSLALYLEVGASDRTMVSFISLGLSRVAAMKLNDLSARKDLDPIEAKAWLRGRPLTQLGLSPLLLQEVQSLLES